MRSAVVKFLPSLLCIFPLAAPVVTLEQSGEFARNFVQTKVRVPKATTMEILR